MRAVSPDRRATLYGLLLVLVVHPLWTASWFPTAQGRIGHDFAGTLPAWLDGVWWARANGPFAVPWFTPSICGGAPLYADPQSGYYSVPQLLSLVVDPMRAAWLATSLFAVLGYLGAVRLARDVAGLGGPAAALGGVVWAFQDFHWARMITGEFGFHGYILAPWAAWLLWHPRERPIGPVPWGGNAVAAGALFAFWLHGGLGTLLVPTGLALLALAPALPGVSLPRFLARGTAAVAVALGLCAAKLVASTSFLSHFPRTDYQLPGWPDPLGAAWASALSLYAPSVWVWGQVAPSLENLQVRVEPHELAYGLGLPAAALTLLLALRRRPSGPLWAWAALGGLVALVVALQVYTPGWNAVLKGLPLLGQTSFPFRWLIVLLPVGALAAARGAEGLPPWVAAAAATLTVGQHLGQDVSYYDAQAFYDPAAVRAAWAEPPRPVTRVVDREVARDATGLDLGPNDWAALGWSATRCYNPIFGYRLEHLPLAPLAPGPVDTAVAPGVLNLKDPACYVFPEANGCAPGDHFSTDRAADLAAFAARRPYPFARSDAQRVTDGVSVVTQALVLLAGALSLRRPAARAA